MVIGLGSGMVFCGSKCLKVITCDDSGLLVKEFGMGVAGGSGVVESVPKNTNFGNPHKKEQKTGSND